MTETEELKITGEEEETDNAVWNILTEEQKKNFKKVTEKNEESMSYIG